MDSFPIIRDISDEIRGDINKCDFLALYDEMSTFKDMHNSIKKYLLNVSCKILQNNTKVKGPFKVQDSTRDDPCREWISVEGKNGS